MRNRIVMLFILSFIFIAGCNTQQVLQKDGDGEERQMVKNVGLGDICSSAEECITFCHDNKGICREYCLDNPENALCAGVFPYEVKNSGSSCEGAKVMFDYAPVNLDETELLLPLGLMAGGHVTPIDHQYFQNFANTEADIEVYSPHDGVVTEIQHMPGAAAGHDYRVVIQHTCTISSIFIHIEVLSEKLMKEAPETFAGVNIPVKAGEVIGWYVKNVDYNLVDTDVVLSGFVLPESYKEQDPWKIHVPDTYEYFNEPVKSKLLAKSVRTILPISGKIDYDIDGTLSGNWFEEGSNGYAGIQGEEYWESHLSFAYDFMDPSLIIISMADYDGKPKQYAVKNNLPNPSLVDTNSGVVKYELVSFGYTTDKGQEWDKSKFAKVVKAYGGLSVDGTVLVQMVDERKIKFEVFAGKTASEVNDFVNPKIYGR